MLNQRVTGRDAVAYLTKKYAGPDVLSESRLRYMVYLADWKSAIERGRQITGLHWEYRRWGLHIPEPVRQARELVGPNPIYGQNLVGRLLDQIPFVIRKKYPTLGDEDRKILDFVVGGAGRYEILELRRLVDSTWPLFSQDPPVKLDLVTLAKDYERVKPLITSEERR